MDTAKINTPETGDILKRFTRELPVPLNDSELQAYGKMLAEKCKEQELAIDRKKQRAAEDAAKIKTVTNEIKRIADARAKGEELRPVICGERLRGNVVEIVRLDRGEVVDTRPAEMRDLQPTLPGTEIPERGAGPIDEGPRGGDFGTPHTGKDVTSSVGDTVHVGDPDDHSEELYCDHCGEMVTEETETAERDGSTVHASCAAEIDRALTDPESASDDAPAVQDVDEMSDDELDRRLAERDSDPDVQAHQAGVNGEKSKPKRERSAKKNSAKKKR